jgi:hypothetical protein
MKHTPACTELAALRDGSCELATLPRPDKRRPARTPSAPDTCESTKAGAGPTFVSDVLFAKLGHRSVVDRVPSGGTSVRARFAEVAGVAEVLAGGPIRGGLQAHLAVAQGAD